MGRGETITCPVCQRSAHLRQDGTIGLHWTNAHKQYRRRCPGGNQQLRKMPAGRRITVTVDLVLPLSEWDMPRAKSAISVAIRDHCPELFAITIDVDEAAS